MIQITKFKVKFLQTCISLIKVTIKEMNIKIKETWINNMDRD